MNVSLGEARKLIDLLLSPSGTRKLQFFPVEYSKIGRSVVKEPRVSDKMAQSGSILEKKWQQTVYEKHRRRVSHKSVFLLLC